MTIPAPIAPAAVPPRMWSRTGMGFVFSRTARNSVAAIGDQAIVSGTNFLTTIIIGHACVPEELGLYTNAFSLVGFVVEMQAALITTPYIVFHPRLEGGEHAQYTGSTLVHQVCFAGLVIPVMLVAGIALSSSADPHRLASIVWPLVALIAFIMVRDYTRQLCFANLRMTTAFISDACVATLQIGGLLALSHFGLLSGGHAYVIIGTACGVVGIVWLLIHRHLFQVRLGHALGDFKRNWTFSRWVFASGVLWSLSMNFYPWIITAFHGTAAAGTWGACIVLVTPSMILLLGSQNFLGPKIATVYAQKGSASLARLVLVSSGVLGIVMLGFSFVMWFLSEPLLSVLYHDRYAGNGMIVFVLSLNFLALGMTAPFSRGLFAIERADIDFVVNFVALFVLLSAGIWLTRAFGVMGAACGVVLANTAALIVRGSAFFRYLRARTEHQGPRPLADAEGEHP